jgi:RNA polymerase sigma-70 factor (ECF subfamily)
MRINNAHDLELLDRVALQDRNATEELFSRYRGRLKALVRLRLDYRIQGRLDESDVVQEALVDASAKISGFARSPDVPFYLWLRQITLFKVRELHRRHLLTGQRDARRELPIQHQRDHMGASSVVLVDHLVSDLTSPSQVAIKSELRRQLLELLDKMDPVDREVLVLRHFEQLTTAEAAEVLDLSKSGASRRYVGALEQLREVLKRTPGLSI